MYRSNHAKSKAWAKGKITYSLRDHALMYDPK